MTRSGSFRDAGWSRVPTEGWRWVLFCFVLPVLLSACLQKRHTWVMLKEIMQTAVLSLPH